MLSVIDKLENRVPGSERSVAEVGRWSGGARNGRGNKGKGTYTEVFVVKTEKSAIG